MLKTMKPHLQQRKYSDCSCNRPPVRASDAASICIVWTVGRPLVGFQRPKIHRRMAYLTRKSQWSDKSEWDSWIIRIIPAEVYPCKRPI